MIVWICRVGVSVCSILCVFIFGIKWAVCAIVTAGFGCVCGVASTLIMAHC